jgi:hypothetical protein
MQLLLLKDKQEIDRSIRKALVLREARNFGSTAGNIGVLTRRHRFFRFAVFSAVDRIASNWTSLGKWYMGPPKYVNHVEEMVSSKTHPQAWVLRVNASSICARAPVYEDDCNVQ